MITAAAIARGWNRFFFEPVSPLPMAVFRILLGLLVLTNQLLLLPDADALFTSRGVLSYATSRTISGGGGLTLFAIVPDSASWMWLILGASCVAAVTLAAGLFTRTSAIVLFLTVVSLHHRNPLILNSGDTFLRLALFYTVFSHGGAALSVDRLLRLRRGVESGPPGPRPPWAMRLIQLQLAFLYLYAFAWKATGPTWLSGLAVYYTSRLPEFWRFPVPYVFDHLWTIKLWTWGTLLVEFALGTLVWVKALRYWVLLAGVVLHLGIDYAMNIPLFGFIMMSAYVTFVEPRHLERIFDVTRRWAPPRGHAKAKNPDESSVTRAGAQSL